MQLTIFAAVSKDSFTNIANRSGVVNTFFSIFQKNFCSGVNDEWKKLRDEPGDDLDGWAKVQASFYAGVAPGIVDSHFLLCVI